MDSAHPKPHKCLWSERSSLTRKQTNRRQLEQFFFESVNYLRRRQFSYDDGSNLLSDGIAEFAFKKFGALASNVLRHWGMNSPGELEESFRKFLKACGSIVVGRSSEFSQSEALNALFRGEYWP